MEVLKLISSLREKQISEKKGVSIITVENPQKGILLANNILRKIINANTVLYLSGGSQKTLYSMLASEQKIKPAAIAMVDERFGPPYHTISNELTVKNTGFIDYLKKQNIPFFSALREGASRQEAAHSYNKTVGKLFSKFSRHVAILGLGVDGHIAGLAPNRADFQNPLFKSQSFAGEFHDPKPMSQDGNPSPPNGFGERITLTFEGLSRMDTLLLIGFGENKKEAFEKMFTGGSREEVPGRFLLEPDIAQKTILITDQKV